MSSLGEVTLAHPIIGTDGQPCGKFTLRTPDLDDMIAVEAAGDGLAAVKALIVRVASPALTPPLAGKIDPRDLKHFVKILRPFLDEVNGEDA